MVPRPSMRASPLDTPLSKLPLPRSIFFSSAPSSGPAGSHKSIERAAVPPGIVCLHRCRTREAQLFT